MTVTAVLLTIMPSWQFLIVIALWVVIAGSLVTAWRRLGRIAQYLRGRAKA